MSMLAVLMFAVAACGDDDSDSGGSAASDGGNAPTQEVPEGRQGGKLTELAPSGDVDYLDPGRSYYQFGFQVIDAMHKKLYQFAPDDPEKAKPDLAEGDPQISADKKTVTVKIKKGVKFGPPVNREVTTEDVKYAFERFFTVNVGGQYTTYFNMIKGAPDSNTKEFKEFEGIKTPDPYTIVFELDKPTGVAFAAALSLPISAPVPKDFAKKFDEKNPSTYNTHVVATGPYMIPNDAEGKLTGYSAGKSIKLVRNPSWDKAKDFKPAYLDEIDIRTGSSDANVAAQQVLTGSGRILDTNPPAQILPRLGRQYKDQYVQVPSGGFRWFPLNQKLKPFDDLNVRKAVLAGFDRDAARKARGGKFTADIPTHFLPPEFPGFEEAGGFETDLDFLKNPKGDMAVAAKYFKAAGYASGKYEGDEEIYMVTANADPGKAQAEVAKAQLEKMGFKVRLRAVPQDATYTEYCQVPAKKVHVCGAAGWFKDFADPQSMLEPTFKGSEIRAQGNNNLGQLDDPAVDKAMDEAAVLEGEARLKAWGEIDKQITALAPAIPFVWDKTTLIWSKDVNGVSNPNNSLLDLTFTSLKQ
ncbi:ABC transporter substrate-binding protein [Conexibacter sp. SYSU D00693]|uniref:ABC transporter substrate-binding protein n=1 Tax=Conexibacter sp. SYSU D00693 TaxID=2812560 RepID=UPI00196A4194|nr:ABC transporter substrate-binding protein [Conexibacter sp. SYSU D00693]